MKDFPLKIFEVKMERNIAGKIPFVLLKQQHVMKIVC